jgi:hypothetical protein
MRFLDAGELLHTRPKLLNDFDPDRDFSHRGEFNFDYVTGLYVNKNFYPLKLDLRTSVPYLPDISCKTCETSQTYFADFSGSAEKIAQFDTSCFGERGPGHSDYILSTEECEYFIHDPDTNLTFNGYFSKDDISYAKNYYLGFGLLGRIKHQTEPYVYKGINGILGMGPSSFDNAFSDSFLNQVLATEGIDAVFSLCANSNAEGGGYMVLGGVDKAMYQGDIHWFKYTSYKFYSINVHKVMIGSVDIGFNFNAVLDTKYEGIVVDKVILEQIKREIKSQMCRNESDYALIEGFCSDEKHVLDGHPIPMSKLHDKQFLKNLPSFNLKVKSDNFVLKIPNYIVP